MDYAQSSDSENKARAARESALAYRPQAAPLPASVAWPADTEPYWIAALQYFEAAQRYYQAADHARGDFCVLRGDSYLLLASLAIQVNSMGVAPLLEERPAQSVTKSGALTPEEFKAEVQQLKESLKGQPSPVPIVPAEAARASQCDYFEDTAHHYFDQAVFATEDGNPVAVEYYLAESHSYEMLHELCVDIEAFIAAM
jgi:hypothetical protein